jgi:hypothetical protein
MVKMLWLIGGLAFLWIINSLILHCNWNSSSQVAVSIDNFILGRFPEIKDLTEPLLTASFEWTKLKKKNNSSI